MEILGKTFSNKILPIIANLTIKIDAYHNVYCFEAKRINGNQEIEYVFIATRVQDLNGRTHVGYDTWSRTSFYLKDVDFDKYLIHNDKGLSNFKWRKE